MFNKALAGREKLLHVYTIYLVSQKGQKPSEAEISAEIALKETSDKDVITQLEMVGFHWVNGVWELKNE